MIFSVLFFAQVGSVQFSVSASPKTVYIGQQVTYDASMRATAYAQANFQTTPEYIPPDVKGVTLYDFPFDTTKSIRDVTVSGLTVKQYTYHRAIFPLTPGSYTIPPALLVYSLPNEGDVYVLKVDTLHSKAQTFVALPLPPDGRPATFSGAVGDFTIAVHIDSGQAFHAGTPFILHVTVTGTGNIDLLPAPVLQIPWATVTKNSSEKVTWDSSATEVRGSKEFQWIVNPQTGGQLAIPAVRYSYFNPITKRYATAASAPVSINIAGDNVHDGLAPGVAVHDTIDNSPFPVMIRAVRAHMIVAVLAVILLLIAIVSLVIFAHDREPVD